MTRPDIPYLDRLKEELMRSITTQQEPQATPPPRSRRLRLALAGSAAAAVVAAGVTAAVVLGGGETPGPIVTSPPGAVVTTPPGGGLGLCIQGGTAEAIGAREYGLSGTITDVTVPPGHTAPTEVTVDVDHWYQGGDAGTPDTVVLLTYTRPAGEGEAISIDGGQVPLEVGARILATGDDDFLWDCGDFSRPWSEEGAALFAEAFGA